MLERDQRVFRITGMDCAEEIALLRREVEPLVGEERLGFDLLAGTMSINGLPDGVDAEAIQDAVERVGLTATPVEQVAAQAPSTWWTRQRRTVFTAVSGLALALGFAFDRWTSAAMVSIAMYTLSMLAGVWLVFPKALSAARRVRPDMNLLMVIAILGAVAIGEWFEGAAIAFLFAVSLLLESWSVDRARRAIGRLLDLSPATVRMLASDGAVHEVPPSAAAVGTCFIVKPGERLPLDGCVVEGRSDVNQAPITGESVPVAKSPGEVVFAGTINGDGLLTVESTKPAGETTLAQIIRLVGEAQSRRGPSEQWVERFAAAYTPIVLVAALAVLLLPPLLTGAAWSVWLYRALVLLLIACPCALVISTPVSIVAGLTAAARQGVLIKGGVHLESPASLRAIALDKTGTLTYGRPRVVEVVPLNGHSEQELLERSAALERHSEHPIAQAVLEYAAAQGVRETPATDFQVLPGKGARGLINGREFWLGSHRYLEERKQETPEIHQRLEAMAGTGRTVVAVGNADHVCGLLALADELRPSAAETMQALRDAGIAHLVMLTGDNRPTAEAVAKRVGVTEFRSELLPQDKVSAIEDLVAAYGQVGMVGDGVNDAPALARSTLGIAMGAVGSDAAIEVADIALMSDDISKLPWLIRHSRRTLRIIRQNIVLSLLVKAVFVVLTLVGYSSLWAAIAADTGASLLVVLNGLRLLQAEK